MRGKDTKARITAAFLAVLMMLPVYIYVADPSYAISFDESKYRTLKSRTVKAVDLGINLRKMLKEGRNGYAVVQGGCTDGRYAYYLMVSSYNQKGRVLKVRMRDHKVVKRGPVVNTWHGNGMTYDSRRKRLVVTACEHRRQEITFIDAKTLKVTGQRNIKYKYYRNAKKGSLNRLRQQMGVAAIAYVPGYDCYVALQREDHNLIVIDPDTLQAIGYIRTKMNGKFSGSYQAMDADEKYVYLLLSEDQDDRRKQPYNLIVAIDWNSENLISPDDSTKLSAGKCWWCGNKRNGRADAVLKIRNDYEAENLYHVTDGRGREHFYLSAYCRDPRYEFVRFKKNGKIRKKKVRVTERRSRGNYVYDLGII